MVFAETALSGMSFNDIYILPRQSFAPVVQFRSNRADEVDEVDEILHILFGGALWP